MSRHGSGRKGASVHGWMILDKPAGISSAKAVAITRRVLGGPKAGHGGTLDPLASGVLPIALGEATKTISYVMGSEKGYEFTVQWGFETSTDDGEGTPTRTSDHRPDAQEITDILPRFTGQIEQVPPVYSAIKIGGKRAYALAREAEKKDEPAEAPRLQARPVDIYELELTEARPDSADFTVRCGKGTYIRSLARDMARALGSAGHITALRRTKVGKFQAAQAISLDLLEKISDSAAALQHVMPVLTALDDIPAVAITNEEARRLRHGQLVHRTDILSADETGVAVVDNQPVALIRETEAGLAPVRVLNL